MKEVLKKQKGKILYFLDVELKIMIFYLKMNLMNGRNQILLKVILLFQDLINMIKSISKNNTKKAISWFNKSPNRK